MSRKYRAAFEAKRTPAEIAEAQEDDDDYLPTYEEWEIIPAEYLQQGQQQEQR